MALGEITVHQVAELERLREGMPARSALSLGDGLLDWKNRQFLQDYPEDAELFVRSAISILTNELHTRALRDNVCGYRWVAEIALCPRCGLASNAHDVNWPSAVSETTAKPATQFRAGRVGTPASTLGYQVPEIRSYAITYAYGRVDALAGQDITPDEAATFAQYCADEDLSHGKLCDAFNAMFPKWAAKR